MLNAGNLSLILKGWNLEKGATHVDRGLQILKRSRLNQMVGTSIRKFTLQKKLHGFETLGKRNTQSKSYCRVIPAARITIAEGNKRAKS